MDRDDIDYAEERIRNAYGEFWTKYYLPLILFGVGIFLLAPIGLAVMAFLIWCGARH